MIFPKITVFFGGFLGTFRGGYVMKSARKFFRFFSNIRQTVAVAFERLDQAGILHMKRVKNLELIVRANGRVHDGHGNRNLLINKIQASIELLGKFTQGLASVVLLVIQKSAKRVESLYKSIVQIHGPHRQTKGADV